MVTLIKNHQKEIESLCRRYNVRRLEIFGSAASGKGFDIKTSDIDFLV
jgi:predicted nucleotidyltransferase